MPPRKRALLAQRGGGGQRGGDVIAARTGTAWPHGYAAITTDLVVVHIVYSCPVAVHTAPGVCFEVAIRPPFQIAWSLPWTGQASRAGIDGFIYSSAIALVAGKARRHTLRQLAGSKASLGAAWGSSPPARAP